MRKTMEQIVIEGQAARCGSLEELYLLWQMMQQMEEEPFGSTCYEEIDPRSFHIDGAVSPEHYDGTLFVLKETSMKKQIRKGQTMPVVSDVRRDLRTGRSPSGEVEYLSYLRGMKRILDGGSASGDKAPLLKTAVIYVNKRGGKGAADDISMDYGFYYSEFLKRQIQLLEPRTIICCGEDIFRLVAMEVFQNKKTKKNQETYMKWKDVVAGDILPADRRFKPVKDLAQADIQVIRMWNPAYRVNNGQYVSLEEYLREFQRRTEGAKICKNC